MTAVFIHGVPETGQVWDRLRARLSTDSTTLDLPGFGVPRPAGFGASLDEYVAWLEQELREIDGPVDLVGHDWGAVFVAHAATNRSLRVRSWAIDVAGVLHPEYVWHDQAQLWRTPGAGEQWAKVSAAAAPGSPESPAVQLTASGVPAEDAAAMGEKLDATMADSILDLYRSATPNPHASWEVGLFAPSAPGLVLQALLDPYDDLAASDEMAAHLEARTQRLEGVGHWWMLEDPDGTAAALERFWTAVGEG
ncbi:alpha/beta fold hydrolase [Streptomyces olivaceus]|uniref:alpha/beta fold hydrolase n=1 Tax=Streptomyces olivaceus TaxID=47716 RepID=UPI004055EDCC